MSILSASSPQSMSIFKHALIQSEELPMSEVLEDRLFADVFEEEHVSFGLAEADVFTPAITLWAMISQFLFSGSGRSVKAAAGRVMSLWAQVANRVVSENAGNYCRAKAKIPVSVIRTITQRLASGAEQASRELDDLASPLEDDQVEDRRTPQIIAAIRGEPIKGRILLVDGFTVDAPDTPENQEVYPQNPVQAEGLGFPILRCVGLFSLVSGLLIDLAYAAYSGKGTGETALLRQLKNTLRPGDILVADSYYCTYWLVDMCMKLKVHLVMKNHHKREDDPLGARRFSEGERHTTWLRSSRPDWMSKRDYKKVAKRIDIRLSDVQVKAAGTRCASFTVATTMLDIGEYPSGWIASLYAGRWTVEPDIASIKCTMQVEHLRSQSPVAIERELWTAMLTYNLVRTKMMQSAYAANREVRSLSFTQTYQQLSTNWLLCSCTGVSKALITATQAQGVVAVVGNRPGRVEPRENKRRPKILKLMTLPYRLLRAILPKPRETQ